MVPDSDPNLVPDPQNLLPADLRSSWIVLPKDSVYQAILVGSLIGAGVVVSIMGFLHGPEWLRAGWPISMALAYLQHKLIPWSENRLLKELSKRTTQSNA